MTTLAYILIISCSLPVAIFSVYLLILTAAAWALRLDGSESTSALTIAVVVPAHNEELQIAATVRAILGSDYPPEQRRVLVIADNCTDRTAQAAQAAGALVFERSNLVERGKGQALDWFFRNHQEAYDDFAAVAVIDADTLADTNFLAAMAGQFSDPQVMASQGFYGVANPSDSWRTLLAAAALAVFNHVRPAGQAGLGVSASLKGNGMMMRSELFRRYGWPAHSKVEDLEFYLLLLKDGIRVHYNPTAVVYGEMAVTGGQSAVQRRRWEGGRLAMLRQHAPLLIKRLVSRRSLADFDALMELAIPPLSLLVSAQLLLFCVSLVWFQPFAVPLGLCLLVSAGYVASGLLQRRMPLMVWLGLLGAPLFILWKLLLYLKMTLAPRSEGWERTQRKAELARTAEGHDGKVEAREPTGAQPTDKEKSDHER